MTPDAGPGRRALVLQHGRDEPPGRVAEWAELRGWTLDVVGLDRDERPGGLSGVDRVISLGSAEEADDESVPWQATERATLRAAAAAGIPILGICFGGQSLALALGGGVRRAARYEIGWSAIGVIDPAGPIDDGPWMEWHRDEIVPPPGATILARNAVGVQAFRSGPHVGLQFHPEVDAAIVGGWIAQNADGAPVPADLAARSAELAPAARDRALRLFDALLG